MTARSPARSGSRAIGRPRFVLLCLLFTLSAAWLYGGLASGWHWRRPGYVNDSGAVIGRDLVAVWTASAEALAAASLVVLAIPSPRPTPTTTTSP